MTKKHFIRLAEYIRDSQQQAAVVFSHNGSDPRTVQKPRKPKPVVDVVTPPAEQYKQPYVAEDSDLDELFKRHPSR
jgi:hypothetical protein